VNFMQLTLRQAAYGTVLYGRTFIQHTVRYTELAPDRFRDFGAIDVARIVEMGMRRTFGFLIGCGALMAGALPTHAGGLGWKVFSHHTVKEPEFCFYGSANVYRANGLLSVWTKCLAAEDLNDAVKADATGSLSDIAAEKIAHDYVPPIARIGALPGDQIVDAVMDEELANNGNIRPLVTALREIDCAKRRARELSVILPVDGQVRSSDTPQDWHPVPSTGELASLSKLLCAQPAPVRHYRRSTSPGKFAGKFNGRRR
jgi:hypothetical protein